MDWRLRIKFSVKKALNIPVTWWRGASREGKCPYKNFVPKNGILAIALKKSQ
jgi:hypothetical protein